MVALQTARMMGNQAFFDGKDAFDCPFHRVSEKAHWQAWNAGYWEGI